MSNMSNKKARNMKRLHDYKEKKKREAADATKVIRNSAEKVEVVQAPAVDCTTEIIKLYNSWNKLYSEKVDLLQKIANDWQLESKKLRRELDEMEQKLRN